MDTKHLDGGQISRLTEQGIWYEFNGKEQFIDFAVCYDSYLVGKSSKLFCTALQNFFI